MLNEEEALYLVERGALELRFEGERGEEEEDDDAEEKEGVEESGEEGTERMGVPMSLQAAYAFLIGAGRGLTLERFIVYSGLKRSGYIVLRAPGWNGEEEHDDAAAAAPAGKKQKEAKSGDEGPRVLPQHPALGWFSRIYTALWASLSPDGVGQRCHHHGPGGAGPLVGLGVYRSYSQYFFVFILSRTENHSSLSTQTAHRKISSSSISLGSFLTRIISLFF